MKAWLRRLPLSFRGTLDGVELVQFSLDLDEAAGLLPEPLTPKRIAGRALVSCANVDLHRMRPGFVPDVVSFVSWGYRHVAFRLLVDDSELNADGTARGIFFVRSFTDQRLIAWGGQLLTHYRLTTAPVRSDASGLSVEHEGRAYRYDRAHTAPRTPSGLLVSEWSEAGAILGALDRAYAVDGTGRVRMTRILRDEWPLEPLAVSGARNEFFETARFEYAMIVPRPVPYTWLPPMEVCRARPPAGS